MTSDGSYSLSSATNCGANSLNTKPNSITGTIADDINTNASTTATVRSIAGQSGSNNHSFDLGYEPCTPPTVAFAASSSAICQGTPVTLTTTATETYSYTISAPTGVILSATNSTSAIATGLTVGVNTFTVTASNSLTCSTTATVSVTVSAVPAITLSATQSTICVGQTVTIDVLGATQGSTINAGVLGDFGAGSLLGIVTSFPVSPTVTTTYSVTASPPLAGLLGSCSSVAQTTIVVNSLPALQSLDISLCAAVGTSVDLNAILTANQSSSALLGLTNVFIGVNGAIANPLAVSLSAGINSFSVVSTSIGGCTTTAPLTIVLTPEPQLDVVITAVTCSPATSQYTLSGTVSLTNAQANVLTITDGVVSTTIAVTNSTTAVSFTLPAQASGTRNHAIVASLPGCTTSNSPIVHTITYTSPASCTVVAPLFTLDKRVSNSVAAVGSVLTYTIVVANVGTASATNVVVTDSSSAGLRYVANSATSLAGITFVQGNPFSTWTIDALAKGQSITLTFQAVADSAGILHSKASIPGDTVSVCTSIPYRVCVGESYLFNLTAPAGRSSYHWFRTFNGVTTELTSFTTNVLQVTAAGSYKLAVDPASSSCSDYSCCPFIVEEDALPVFAAITIPATCTGNTGRTTGQIVLSNFRSGYTYQYSRGATFSTTASLSGAARTIPTNGIITTNLANPAEAQAYTVRVYNATGCHTDVTVMLKPTVCGCLVDICVPYVISQVRRPVRIGDPR